MYEFSVYFNGLLGDIWMKTKIIIACSFFFASMQMLPTVLSEKMVVREVVDRIDDIGQDLMGFVQEDPSGLVYSASVACCLTVATVCWTSMLQQVQVVCCHEGCMNPHVKILSKMQ